MIKSLLLKFGETPEHPPLSLPIGSAVVIVGPNNSGKSRLLQELEHYITREARSSFMSFTRDPLSTQGYLILQDIEAEIPRSPNLRTALTSEIKRDLPEAAFTNPGTPLPEDAESLVKLLFELFPKATDMLEKGKLALTPEFKLVEGKLQKLLFPLLLNPSHVLAMLAEGDKAKETLEEKAKKHMEDIGQDLLDLLRAGIQFLKDLRERSHTQSPEEAILHFVQDGRICIKPYLPLLSPKTVRLDGKQRLLHVAPTPLPRQGEKGNNHLTRLLWNEGARRLLQKIVLESFGYHLSIDVSSFDQTRIKMSREPAEAYEHSFKPEALEYFRRATDIESFSDGVKSFVGLLAALLSDEYIVMLIDEPEAFLHPPLARRLGQELHQLSRDRGAHVLAATHSADFLMGCLQAAPDVHIVRLTYRQDVPSARLLPREALQQMMHDPLLRSTGTLSALFHEGAIVCEGDSDRAFYQEINERLLAQSERKVGAVDCLFINAHNKQSIHRVVGLLRRMGVPAAAIIDLDIIIDEKVLKELLTAVGTDTTTINTLGMAKGEFFHAFVKAAQDDVKKAKVLLKTQGLAALNESQRRSMESVFFDPLARLGIFIVPEGEVESWLAYLLPAGPRPAKQDWLTVLFEALGSDPHNEHYVRPRDGDVWDFMRKIARWIGDPKRQGMPTP
jgi:predicted ATP-dependent endonuclease of OLD family